MTMKIFVLIFILTLGSLNEATISPDVLKNFLNNSLEEFKMQMKVGIPDLQIPILDPYFVDDVTLKEDDENTKLTVDLSDVKISGLSDFEFDLLAVDASALTAQITFKTQQIRGEGHYKLDGVIFTIFPLTGDGPFWIQADEVTSQSSVQFELIDDHLKITDLHFNLQSSTISGNFENILGGGELGEIVNTILNKFGKKIFDHYSPKLMEKINQSFVDKANKELETLPIE